MPNAHLEDIYDDLHKLPRYNMKSTPATMVMVTMHCLPDDDHASETPPNEDNDDVQKLQMMMVSHMRGRGNLAEACRS